VFSLLLLNSGCQKFEFNNPVDSNNVLLPPTNLSSQFVGDSTVRLQWIDPNTYSNNDRSIVNYVVEYGTDGILYSSSLTASGDSTATIITIPFQRLQKVYFRIRVSVNKNLSSYSTPISTEFSLGTPYGLTLISFTETEARISWSDTNKIKSYFEILLSIDGTSYTTVGTIGKDTTSAIIQYPFLISTAYSFRVCTRSAGDLKKYSDTIQAQLQYPAPVSLTMQSISETSLKLQWTSTATIDRNYIIERKVASGRYSEIAQVTSPTQVFTDASLQKNQRYVYRVKAHSLYNTSAYSSEISVACKVQTATPSVPLIGHLTGVLAIAFSPSGSTFISGGSDGRIVVWDAASGGIIYNLAGHSRPVNGIAFSPDGSILASASSDKTVQLWKMSDGTPVDTFKSHLSSVLCVAYSPDGKIIASGGADQKVRLWYPATDSAVALPGHADVINAVAFSPDGAILASASSDNTLRLWSTSTGFLLRILSGHTSAVTSVQFTPDNQSIISGSYDKTIRVWRISDGTLVQTITTDSSEVTSLAISSDGRLLASGCANNLAHLWLNNDGLFPISLSQHSQMVNAVAFSPGNSVCLTASNDKSVVIWQLTSAWTVLP
jgi:WD40 repeat protein